MYFSEIQEDEPSSGLPASLLPATKGRVQQTATDIQRQFDVSNQLTLYVLMIKVYRPQLKKDQQTVSGSMKLQQH